VKAELRDYLADVHDPHGFEPACPDEFGYNLQLFVGTPGTPGTDQFQVTVCTPKWLETDMAKGEVRMGRHLLIVREYDFDGVIRFVREFIEGLSGESWHALARELGKLGRWEYEGHEDEDVDS
jgi:hypothetical protein